MPKGKVHPEMNIYSCDPRVISNSNLHDFFILFCCFFHTMKLSEVSRCLATNALQNIFFFSWNKVRYWFIFG